MILLGTTRFFSKSSHPATSPTLGTTGQRGTSWGKISCQDLPKQFTNSSPGLAFPKTHMETQNDGVPPISAQRCQKKGCDEWIAHTPGTSVWKGNSLLNLVIFGIYVRFRGCTIWKGSRIVFPTTHFFRGFAKPWGCSMISQDASKSPLSLPCFMAPSAHLAGGVTNARKQHLRVTKICLITPENVGTLKRIPLDFTSKPQWNPFFQTIYRGPITPFITSLKPLFQQIFFRRFQSFYISAFLRLGFSAN